MDRRGGPEPAAVLTREVLTVEEYRAELLAQLRTCRNGRAPEVESVRVTEAVGRVLAEPVVARVPVPAFDNSGMDGYAVRLDDLAERPARLRVVAEVPAGSGASPSLGPRECARIMTGGLVPDDADTIVPVEMTSDAVAADADQAGPDDPGDRGAVTILEAPPERGAFVRRRGSALDVGTQVCPSGTRVDAGVLAAAVSAGTGHLVVACRPRVAIASTGDELVAPGAPLARGQIHDVNTAYLTERVRALGAEATSLAPLPDDPEGFADAIAAASARHDLVIVSGGASVGDHDVARMVLGAREVSAFRHVRMQPGKPQGWARWGDALVVGLPGNPLSAAVSFALLVRPLVEDLLGLAGDSPTGTEPRARAARDWRSPAGRRQLVPARLASDDGALWVDPVHAHGSASHLTTVLATAEVLAVVPEDTETVVRGDLLDTVWFR